MPAGSDSEAFEFGIQTTSGTRGGQLPGNSSMAGGRGAASALRKGLHRRVSFGEASSLAVEAAACGVSPFGSPEAQARPASVAAAGCSFRVAADPSVAQPPAPGPSRPVPVAAGRTASGSGQQYAALPGDSLNPAMHPRNSQAYRQVHRAKPAILGPTQVRHRPDGSLRALQIRVRPASSSPAPRRLMGRPRHSLAVWTARRRPRKLARHCGSGSAALRVPRLGSPV